MENFKMLSVYDLAMKLNTITRAKSAGKLDENTLAQLNCEWNLVVYELWQRIPSLKEDTNIQLIKQGAEEKVFKRELKKR